MRAAGVGDVAGVMRLAPAWRKLQRRTITRLPLVRQIPHHLCCSSCNSLNRPPDALGAVALAQGAEVIHDSEMTHTC